MIEYEDQPVTTAVKSRFVCDCCAESWSYDDLDDWTEIQEAWSLGYLGGYGSIFGNMSSISVDLCQRCVERLLGDYLRIDEDDD